MSAMYKPSCFPRSKSILVEKLCSPEFIALFYRLKNRRTGDVI